VEPIAKGGPDGASWHATLANSATLTDAIDVAAAEGGLLALGDYFESANELKLAEDACKAAHDMAGTTRDPAAYERSKKVRAALTVTRCEALLIRLFLPDAMTRWNVDDRDLRVRAIKSMCLKHARWSAVFKPIHARAVDAMALI